MVSGRRFVIKDLEMMRGSEVAEMGGSEGPKSSIRRLNLGPRWQAVSQPAQWAPAKSGAVTGVSILQ